MQEKLSCVGGFSDREVVRPLGLNNGYLKILNIE